MNTKLEVRERNNSDNFSIIAIDRALSVAQKQVYQMFDILTLQQFSLMYSFIHSSRINYTTNTTFKLKFNDILLNV